MSSYLTPLKRPVSTAAEGTQVCPTPRGSLSVPVTTALRDRVRSPGTALAPLMPTRLHPEMSRADSSLPCSRRPELGTEEVLNKH